MAAFTDQIALVTGAGQGIGRATALALAKEGARLVLCDVAEAALAETAAAVGPERCLYQAVVDVGDREAMAAFADAVHERVPALDLLINNAGVGLAGGALETPLSDWDWVLRINLGGVLHGVHFFVPPMVRRRRGHVVNVSSALGYWAAAGMAGYATSKFAVYGLSESLRHELAPHGIGVSVICPGIISTGIVDRTRLPGHTDPDAARQTITGFYRRRNYPPERVAAAILRGIRRNRFLVPVTPEAWLLLALTRWAPAWAHPIGNRVSRWAMPLVFPET
jgi:NAD(P)-dependent dehydrogenase (short-subunit alcohol dehydrogenase family)